jgi:Holliday junction DNA helicase RuvB
MSTPDNNNTVQKAVETDSENTIPKSTSLDSDLRPHAWDEYIGQNRVKNNLHILLSAAQAREHPPEHILFYGPPGLGKTTLAHLIARELGAQMKLTSGPAIEKVGDLASIITNLNKGDVLFIDEIHRLNKAIEEVLYPAMESGTLDIIIGKGPSARTLQLELPPFTLVAATTQVAGLSAPLRSRFSGGSFRLEYYSQGDIEQILKRSASLLEISLDDAALSEVAKRSRSTPRIANYLLKRCRDYADVHGDKQIETIDEVIAKKALDLLEVDELGLNFSDRELLEIIIHKFNNGPVGLSTLAAATGEDASTIENVHEPYLLQLGLIERTPRGRMATQAAKEHLAKNEEKYVRT